MRHLMLICLLAISVSSRTQTMTVVTSFTNGARDTIQFGFVSNATLGEDIGLGEQNLFMTPVSGYEGRILQRDSNNFSCAQLSYDSYVYYPANFDTKINYRDLLDTSIQNRLFEIWYSDNQTDSIEFICDIPLKSFFLYGHLHPFDCYSWPPAVFAIQGDTAKRATFKPQVLPGIKQLIIITNPNITTTALDEKVSGTKDQDISLYPNPTSGKIFIQTFNAQEISKIFIYDFSGKLIKQFDSVPYTSGIDLSMYGSGVYVARIVLKNGKHVIKKIVKL